MTQDTDKKQVLLKRLASAFSEIPFNRMLGLHLDYVESNHVIMSFDMKQELIGNFFHGILHGGVISSVLDMAGGMAVMSALAHNNIDLPIEQLAQIIGKTSTIDLFINYLSPGRGEVFTAKSWLIKQGKKISFTRMELYNQDEELIATGNATYST